MAQSFTQAQWQTIEQTLEADPAAFGMPQRRDGSVVIASWNIRKLGALAEGGELKKSPGATRMLARFCAACDLIAIQEVQRDTEALYDLRNRLNADGGAFEVVISDVTGLAPGSTGMAERFAWLYNTARVRRGDLASDLSFDRSEVIKHAGAAFEEALAVEVGEEGSPGFMDRLRAFLAGFAGRKATDFDTFIEFIRSPHIVEFLIPGPDGQYRFFCVNAHLVSTGTKDDRAREFFALLEWLLIDAKNSVSGETSTMVLADLNLDFKSNVDKRKQAVEDYVTSINAARSLTARVNFPFLDKGFMTNARRDQTYDQIYWITADPRLPKGRHNAQSGALGADGYDVGMFDFVELFVQAGPGAGPDGPAYELFSHDFTDHMPIWVRLEIPRAGQPLFEVDPA